MSRRCYGPADGPPAKSVEPPRPWQLAHHPAFHVELRAADIAVIGCHFNPAGFRRPVQNMAAWLDWLWGCDVPVYMAELAYYDRPYVLPACDRVIQRRAGLEGVLFQKEHLLNLVAAHVPRRFSYLLALDADVILESRDWLAGVRAALATASLVQPYSHAQWTQSNGADWFSKPSAGWQWMHRRDPGDVAASHPGFGFAMRREFFSELGGFSGCAILGGGDIATTLGAAGQVEGSHFYFSRNPRAVAGPQLAWARRLAEWTRGRLPCVAGRARHLWHGEPCHRGYETRYEIVSRHDPATDLTVRLDGLTVWSDYAMRHKADMVQAVASYFPTRREDG